MTNMPVDALEEARFQQPDGLEYQQFTTSQNVELRIGIVPTQNSKGYAVILPGLFETAEKYYETIQNLQDQGLSVAIIDLPMQGGSQKYAKNPKKRHTLGFDQEIEAVAEAIDHIFKNEFTDQDKPSTLVAHSTGAHFALRYLSERTQQNPFDQAVLSAPLIDLNTAPYPPIIAKAMAFFMCCIGCGHFYVPGGKDWSPQNLFFGGKKTSHDEVRAHLLDYCFMQDSNLISSGPTFKWINEAFNSNNKLHKAQSLQNIDIPVHLYTAEHDEFVDYRRLSNLLDNIKNIKHTQVGGASHELFMERDDMRGQIMRDPFLNP